jgi:OOP family OmpA-OmpF porin
MDKEEMMAEKAPEPEENPAPPPPPPPPPAPAPAPEPASVEKVVLSGRALFPYDSADLTAQGSREMDGLIDKLGSYQDIELIDVVGHADSRGSLEYNQALSERRAETVKGKLEGAFPQVPITASGLGETAPIASNDTAEGRRLNRRVEIRVEAIN